MKFGVIVFPGSNCDDDMIHVLGTVMGQEVHKIWHKETQLDGYTQEDCIVIPGGFSYGDYLRSGAIARFSPIMQAVIAFANQGGLVWGICNGFQVLCESGLLPGVLMRNRDQKFICKNVHLSVSTKNSAITRSIEQDHLYIPIAHADGRYHIDQDGLKQLQENDQILFQYCDASGAISEDANVNGSVANIAGICNTSRNVFGMMPHAERASEDILGNKDGWSLFNALINAKVEAV